MTSVKKFIIYLPSVYCQHLHKPDLGTFGPLSLIGRPVSSVLFRDKDAKYAKVLHLYLQVTTDVPAKSDHAMSDILAIVTKSLSPKSFINKICHYCHAMSGNSDIFVVPVYPSAPV